MGKKIFDVGKNFRCQNLAIQSRMASLAKALLDCSVAASGKLINEMTAAEINKRQAQVEADIEARLGNEIKAYESVLDAQIKEKMLSITPTFVFVDARAEEPVKKPNKKKDDEPNDRYLDI